ncbi:serine hydroxymethyltransferase [Candidatus Saccharibacteria bacterium]|nr:serine hydroxymethyltransferase [Candidatus Saccharibacteria bacterium]
MAKDIVFRLIDEEKTRQTEGLELIPSENYVSKDVLEAMGSVLTNKYSEGYPAFEGTEYVKQNAEKYTQQEKKIVKDILPNHRYYGGQRNVDRIERLAISRACRLFHADHANVQPHSGANANEAVYFSWLDAGDKVLAMDLGHGGHLTHGSPVTRSAKYYSFVPYGTTKDGDIDYKDIEKKAITNDVKIILCGYSAFMKVPDFKKFVEIRDKAEKKWGHEILLMADMAHVAGLIAAGVHPNPLDYGFNVMTTTTHKTLRGPRGGIILTKGVVSSPLSRVSKELKNIPTLIDRAVFPGTQGGPLEHVIAAKAVAFNEALQPEFKDYAKNIVKNAQKLGEQLKSNGFILQGNGTENHLLLVRVEDSFGINGKFFEKALDLVGLTLNANALPGDKGGAFKPGGVRLGTPAITTRGMGEKEMVMIADWMKEVADLCVLAKDFKSLEAKYKDELERIHTEVIKMSSSFPVPSI